MSACSRQGPKVDHSSDHPALHTSEFIGVRSIGEGLLEGAHVTQRQLCHQKTHCDLGTANPSCVSGALHPIDV